MLTNTGGSVEYSGWDDDISPASLSRVSSDCSECCVEVQIRLRSLPLESEDGLQAAPAYFGLSCGQALSSFGRSKFPVGEPEITSSGIVWESWGRTCPSFGLGNVETSKVGVFRLRAGLRDTDVSSEGFRANRKYLCF